ncbi:hypothetical protein [Aquimarina pacifica]|uniref:hypothetical protein n=1 Tax=Aquimarina pacifica TaxID=1296415 RepID=UPI0004709D06|nr:hypothetical protein [Aquimarina pacifica]
MYIEILQVLQFVVSTGLLVLIWIVQLIIYPSFSYFNESNLFRWHGTYTPRIGFIVVPMMLTQLTLAIYSVLQEPTFISVLLCILVGIVWLSTFLQFVPMHQKISNQNVDTNLLDRLTRLNWLRTIVWSLIFLLSAVEFFLK